jgi:hypothetical protein
MRLPRTLTRRFGLLRAPILTLLVGVGFVVQGPRAPIVVVQTTTGASVTDAGEATHWAIHSAPAGSTLLPRADQLLEKRGQRARLSGGPGRDPDLDRQILADPSPAASWRALATGVTSSSAASVSHRDAVSRAGRLSAPSTAPPTSPF